MGKHEFAKGIQVDGWEENSLLQRSCHDRCHDCMGNHIKHDIGTRIMVRS